MPTFSPGMRVYHQDQPGLLGTVLATAIDSGYQRVLVHHETLRGLAYAEGPNKNNIWYTDYVLRSAEPPPVRWFATVVYPPDACIEERYYKTTKTGNTVYRTYHAGGLSPVIGKAWNK